MIRPSLAVLITALFSVVASPVVAQGRPASVTTDLVTTRDVAETVSVFGQVVAGRQSDVAVRIMGVAEAAPLRAGDVVQQGDVLFELDTERLEIDLQQAEAELIIAEAGVAAAQARADRLQRVLERTRSLVSNATVSQSQLDDRAGEYAEALGNLQQAQARITAARAGLRAAQYDLDNAVVRAPFDGTILEVTAEVGEFVAAGAPIARILDNGALEVEANVPSRFVDALQSGQTVAGRTDTGGAMSLELRAILPTEFSSTRTRPVRFTLAEGAPQVAVGQSVALDVPVSAAQEVVVVSKDAVVQSAQGWQVFVHEDGKAAPRIIEIDRAIGDAFEVVSGLVPGDEVVVRGNERLRPGQDIAPMPLSSSASSDSASEG
ncbi:MAG: efflux RND transporter periplasmic adaptor subunit [Pseudomonadota bacterium]